MLSSIRAFAHTWIAKALIGLLIVIFTGFGVSGYLHGKINDDVVEAGSHTVSASEFKSDFERYLQRVGEQQGQSISNQDAVTAGLDTRILDEMESEKAYAEYAQRLGVTPSDSLIAQELTKEPAFANPVTGKFDRQTYLSVLHEHELTAPKYEGELRDEIMRGQLDAGLGAGLQLPRTYAALYAIGKLETRDLSFFPLTQQNIPPPPPPTDAQMQAFLAQNARKMPEMRVLTVVRFSAKALAPSMPVDPAALQTLYEFRKDAASTPEKRSLVQIPAKDAATAAQIAARLRAGQDPATIARSLGVQPVIYTSVPQAGVADPKIGAAAFALKSGEISGPIQGQLGLGVVEVTGVQPGHAPTLDEMRPQLEAQVRADAASKRVFDLVRRYQDARNSGVGLAQAAQAAGAVTQSLGPINAQGASPDGSPIQGLSPTLLRDAFRLPLGGDSDLEKDSAGEYFAVHVDKIVPPSLPALADIRSKLQPYLAQLAIEKALEAKADELIARVRKGETLQAVAASVGAQVRTATGITRSAAGQNQFVGPELAQRIFAAKKGDVFAGATPQQTILVARIDSSTPPAPADGARTTVQVVADLSQSLAQDMSAAFGVVAKSKIKPTVNLDRARQALGVTAPAAAAGAGQTAPPSPAP